MKYIICIFLLVVALSGQAQVIAPEWEISLESNVKWLEVNDWGILMAAASDGLYGLDPTSGEQLWKVPELTSMKREGYKTVPGTPVILLEDGPLLIALNGLSGQVIVNSADAGFEKVQYTEAIPEIAGLLIEYKNSENKGLALFDLVNGGLKWTNDFADMKGTSELQPVPQVDDNGDIYYAYGKNLLKLDGANGNVSWQVETSKPVKDLFFDPQETMIVVVDGSVSNAFRSDNRESKITTTVQGNTGKFNLTAYDLSSGAEKWSHEYKSKYAGVAAGETDFILFHAFSINFIDFQSGKKIWKKEPKYVGGGRNTGLLVDDKGVLYAIESAINDARTNIYYISHEGEELWKKAPYTSAGLYHLQKVPGGVLYISPTGANIIDIQSGKVVWEDNKYISSGGQPILVNFDDAGNPLLLVRGQILRVLPEAKNWELFAADAQLHGDAPTSFEKVDGGYRITSAQQLLMVDEAGKKKYHVYYPAPEQSLGTRLLLSIASVAVTYTSAYSFGTRAVAYNVTGYASGNGDYVEQSSGYLDLFMAGTAVGDVFSATARRRFTTLADAPDYKLILTKKEKNIGLVKVDLQTGKETGFVATDDRTPEFVLDRVDHKLFFKSGARRVAAYEM